MISTSDPLGILSSTKKPTISTSQRNQKSYDSISSSTPSARANTPQQITFLRGNDLPSLIQTQTVDEHHSFRTAFTTPSFLSQKNSEQQQQYCTMQLLKHQINVLEEQIKIIPQIIEKLDNLVAMNTRLESNNLALQVKFEEYVYKSR